jgi:hypothetical protein
MAAPCKPHCQMGWNLAEIFLAWSLTKIVQMVLVCCISESQKLKIELKSAIFKKNFSIRTLKHWFSTSFVKIIALGSKFVCLRVIWLYIESYKEIFKYSSHKPEFSICVTIVKTWKILSTEPLQLARWTPEIRYTPWGFVSFCYRVKT